MPDMTQDLVQFQPLPHHTPVTAERLKAVQTQLRQHGAVAYDLWLPETHYLPHLLHDDEQIMGSVYGKYHDGRGVLMATDQRVLFIDRKPMFLHVDQLGYDIIGGVTFTKAVYKGFVTLHTRLGDYKLRTFNFKNARNFVDYIEAKCFEHSYPQDDLYPNLFHEGS